MQNRSNTSIQMSDHGGFGQSDIKFVNPRVRGMSGDLTIFKKESPSMMDENYEPQLGLNDPLGVSINQEMNLIAMSQRFEELSYKQEQSIAGTTPKVCISYKSIWLRSGLNIIRIVSKFIRTLKINTKVFQYKMIDQKMINLLGDKASSSKIFIEMKNALNYKKNQYGILSNFDEIISYLLLHSPKMSPDNSFLLIVRIFVFILLVINIIYFPLEIFFTDYNVPEIFHIILDIIPVMFCVIDSLFKLVTKYYDQGVLINDISKILINYFQNDLLLDLLCLIPSASSNSTLGYLKVCRILKLKYLYTEIEEVIYFKERIQGYLELIKSIFFILYVCHFCACVWYQIGQIGLDTKTGWMIQKNVDDHSTSEKYSYSLYFIVITTLTIGYGDILPSTLTETFFVMFLAFTGCSILGYTINNIGEILKNINEKEVKFKYQMKSIQQYLKDYGISQKLSLQIRKYFQYHLKSQIEKNNQGYELMKQLSKQLKEQMQIDLYKRHLLKARIIKENCSMETIENLCQYVQIESYVPESIILEQGTNPLKLYFIIEGEAQLFVTLDKQDICIVDSLQAGSVIGQWDFLMQRPYIYSIKALKYSQLLSINITDFCNIIRRNKYDYEKFSHMKDKMIFSNLQQGKKCFICNWIHYFDKCPFVFFVPNKLKILNLYNKNEPQKNRQYQTRRKLKYQLFKNLSIIRKSAIDFIQDDDDNNEVDGLKLLDYGFPQNDSLFQRSEFQIIDDFKTYQDISERNVESSGESEISQKPLKINPFKHNKKKSIIVTSGSRRESISNLKMTTNTIEFNKNQNTYELKKRRQSQASLFQRQPSGQSKAVIASNQKIDSKLNFLKKHDNSSNFSQLQAFSTSNLQVPQESNSQECQPGSSLAQKNEQPSFQNDGQIQNINLDIDRLLVTKFYFTDGNIIFITASVNSRVSIKFQKQNINIMRRSKLTASHVKLSRSEHSKRKLFPLKN